MDMKVLIYIMVQHLMVVCNVNEGITRFITPDPTLLPVWNDYPATQSSRGRGAVYCP